MKKEKLVEVVKAEVEKVGVDKVDKNALAGVLLAAGASFAMINRELPSVLKELGVKTERANSTAPEIVALRKAIKIPKKGFADTDAFVKFVDTLESEHKDVERKRIVKEVKAAAKKAEVEVPRASKLGAQKSAIVECFIASDGKCTLEDVAKAIHKAMEEPDKEKALRTARMNYTFAKRLWEHNNNA